MTPAELLALADALEGNRSPKGVNFYVACDKSAAYLRQCAWQVPVAWMGPVGQTMPHAIYVDWSAGYPDDAAHFTPLYAAPVVAQPSTTYLQLPPLTDVMYHAARGLESIDDDALDNIWESINTALRVAQVASPVAQQPTWVSVADRMPTAGVKVLVCYRNSYGNLRRTCAHYSPLHMVDASTWDGGEPDETEDGTFEPEGWWEEPVELERVEFIADEVTHWMPLPEPPDRSKP